ncbi:MAG: class I SAM-dependent methyltransferase [Nitrospirota bacterium]|nr:class I SAM-dependent methyltransferase [Nitrospirota bacterium]
MSQIASREPRQSRQGSAETAGSANGGSTQISPVQEATRPTVATVNQNFYDGLWSGSHVVLPHRFNTWPRLASLAASAPARLEIGPGLRPRLPILGTSFVDISRPALSGLKACGGHAMHGEITALPFPDCSFDLVCAFDIVEHIEDDRQAFRELSRVAKDDATVIFSVPLHPDRWTSFDTLVGHARRYDPSHLLAILEEHALALEQSALFGMQPRNGWLLDFAVWGMTHKRAQAMRWYNGIFLPIGLFLQPRLAWTSGLIDVANVDEILLVCRRNRRQTCLMSAEDVGRESLQAAEKVKEDRTKKQARI